MGFGRVKGLMEAQVRKEVVKERGDTERDEKGDK